MIASHYRHHRGGLSTMAYILMFAFATFCAIVATFALLARNPVQPVTGQPDQPVPNDFPAQHG